MIAPGYPTDRVSRTQWIVSRRGARNSVRADRPHAMWVEKERTDAGEIADVATVFLTNRECPWRCVMCDLWRNTTEAVAPAGAIVEQVRAALATLPKAPVLKLYNSGSFFDRGAIPESEWPELAELCAPFERVIVECHPLLVASRAVQFSRMVKSLEVAMGLETCHPIALEALNKGFTLADYKRAASFLRANDIEVRTFLLVAPPFIEKEQQERWLAASVETALECGSTAVSLIPTRTGNGAMDELQRAGLFAEPSLSDLESAHDLGLALKKGRVFADTWDLARFSRCDVCLPRRTARIHRMNLSQTVELRDCCSHCER